MELALREALQLNHSYIGTEHILLGLVREGEGVAATVLVRLGADLPRLRREVESLMSADQEAQGGRHVGDPDEASGRSLSEEPRCPRCSARVTDGTRVRTILVPSEEEEADPLSMLVVYCVRCGSALHMFRGDSPS